MNIKYKNQNKTNNFYLIYIIIYNTQIYHTYIKIK